MQDNEQVSVIMPCYNGAETLRLSIESVMNQSYQNFKLYIIDDGSKDETPKILEQMQRMYPSKIWFQSQENQGQTKSKNNAIAQIKGQYIALIDSDDLWQRDKLLKQVEIFNKNPTVGLCYTNGYYIDEKGHVTGHIGIDPTLQGACLDKIMMGNAIVASSVMFRSEVFSKTALFDERFSACENWDLWTRISQHYNLYALDEALVCYRRHQNNMSLNFEKLRENRIKVINKNLNYYKDIFPNISQLTKDARFKAHRFFGENYLWHLDLKKARKDLILAILIKPQSISCYKLLLKTLLGRYLLSKLRTMRGGQLAR